jgi:hypothetical protein
VLTTSFPDLETFLAAPEAEVAKLAPATVVAAFGGTRRSAMLAGMDFRNKATMEWQRQEMLRCYELLFRHGVAHVIAPVAIGKHLAEAGAARERVLAGIGWGMAGPDILADYARLGWRVRMIGIEQLPELAPVAEQLRSSTSTEHGPTLWFWVCADPEAPMQAIFDAAHRTGARTRAELASVLYGEDIPPAAVLLGFGEPTFSYELIPPLLMQRLEAYWIQRPGYRLDQPMLRRILYDYAYLRRTGSGVERNERYAHIQSQRAAWLTDWVLGVGIDVGGFWYPAPFAGVPEEGPTIS